MRRLKTGKLLDALWHDDDGVTAIEYALLAALIFVVIVAAVRLVGTNLSVLFDSVAAAFS